MKNLIVYICCLAWGTSVYSQGSLTPPGPPGPTMKTLDQVEPRTPIDSLPVSINQSGSYYLTGNLNGDAGGIAINVDDVTVDLMGFTITAGVSGQGITINDADNVIVKNGTIRGFVNGVFSVGYSNLRLANLNIVKANGRGITLRDNLPVDQVNLLLIEGCAITDSFTDGIRIILDGNRSDVTVRDSRMLRNGENGVEFICNAGVESLLLERVKIASNNNTGLIVQNSAANQNVSGLQIKEVISNGNNGRGIHIEASADTHFRGVQIQNNNVTGNSNNGISLSGLGQYVNVWIEKNQVAGNEGNGLQLSNVLSGKVSDNLVMEHNDSGTDKGLVVYSGCSGLIITGNTVINNSDNLYVFGTHLIGEEVSIGAGGTIPAATSPFANFVD